MGYKKEVLAIVEEITASKGNQIFMSNGWWESFRCRHPDLTLRTVSYTCFVANDIDVIF